MLIGNCSIVRTVMIESVLLEDSFSLISFKSVWTRVELDYLGKKVICLTLGYLLKVKKKLSLEVMTKTNEGLIFVLKTLCGVGNRNRKIAIATKMHRFQCLCCFVAENSCTVVKQWHHYHGIWWVPWKSSIFSKVFLNQSYPWMPQEASEVLDLPK